MAAPTKPALTCPSAQPDMEGAAAFGMRGGTSEDPRLVYLKRDAVVDEPTIRSLGALDPTRVFRFSGRCEEGRCAQFAGGRCSLAGRIVERLQPAVAVPPPCRIRDTCRWHAEEGTAACLRCPQIVTLVPGTRTDLVAVAQPGPVPASSAPL